MNILSRCLTRNSRFRALHHPKEEALKMQEQGIMIPYWFLDKLFEIRGVRDAHRGRQVYIRLET